MIRTLQRLLDVPPGLADPARVLVADVDLPPHKFSKIEELAGFQQAILRRASALPGVRSAAFVSTIPLDGRYQAVLSFLLPDRPPPPPGQGPEAEVVWATPGYLQTLGIPLLRGRNLEDTDDARSHKVVLVNEAFTRRYGEPRRIKSFLDNDDEWEIVGVIGDVHTQGLDQAPKPQIIVPFGQNPVPFMRLAARTSGSPMDLAPLLRTEVLTVDRDQPFAHPRTLASVVSESVGQRRFQMLLLSLFGAVAVILAALGIYGVMAYSVTQRSREFGIRMALGAQAGEVLRMVVARGLWLALLGVALGIPAALLLTKALGAALYEVSATDPLTFAAVAALVVCVAALASFLPARRATRVDPATPLRAE
jgi:putative ABC transport system permease protein